MKAVLAAMLIATGVNADPMPDRVSILLGSYHANPQSDFNEFNPGVFLTWEGETFHTSVGVYENSFNHTSVALTTYVPLIEWDDGNAGPFGGLALYPETGRIQQVHVGDVIPVGGLQVRHGNAFMQVIPTFGFGADAIVSFGATFSLN